jgi:hypothetical protein
LALSSRESKKDERLKNSGSLIGFEFQGYHWNIINSPNFYDYLYIRALNQYENNDLVHDFDSFTDIAFSQTSLKYNKKLSFNCQARSVAIYSGLRANIQKSDIVDRLFELTQKYSELPTDGQLSLDI